ncbi:hypothetical protein C1886_19855, partial [Pseudomonas sp. FW300-N1A1]
ELVGSALAGGANRVLTNRALSVRGVATVKTTVDAGRVLARAGAVISAAAGLFESTQAGVAMNRTWRSGDTTAATGYGFSMVLSSIGTGFSIYAAASTTSALLGPLGIAMVLGFLAYGFYQWAQRKESSPFEQWAKRCYFGHANETPKVHWLRPDQAHIAIAELNAATLGLEAGVNFRLRMTGLSSPDYGGPIAGVSAPVYEQCLEYRLSLPYFDATRSAYRWTLTIHRHGDGPATQYTRGEVVVGGELNPPAITTSASERRAALATSTPPKKPDYRANSTTPRVTIRTVHMTDGSSTQVKDIQGAIVLLLEARHYNIEGATLSLTYWPDREVQEAYAELSMVDFQ